MDNIRADYMWMESHIDVDSNSFRTLAGDFDEWTYLFHNADVALGVRPALDGILDVPVAHEIRHLYRNNRRPAPRLRAPLAFDDQVNVVTGHRRLHLMDGDIEAGEDFLDRFRRVCGGDFPLSLRVVVDSA